MSLYIEKGEPTRQGWKRLQFYKVDYYNPNWELDLPLDDNTPWREPHDHEFFTFNFLQKM